MKAANATREKAAHVWARHGLDWYVEPREAVAFLLAREGFEGPVLDPACGMGTIVRCCLDHGLKACGMDIVRRTFNTPSWFKGVADFLAEPIILWPGSIICNPPYYSAKGAEAFIRRAVTTPGVRKVAMVVNGKFLFGQGRANGLFVDHPPSRVWPIFPRPSMPPGEWLAQGNVAGGGIEDFVWIIWEPPIIQKERWGAIRWGPPHDLIGDVI